MTWLNRIGASLVSLFSVSTDLQGVQKLDGKYLESGSLVTIALVKVGMFVSFLVVGAVHSHLF